MTTEIQASAEGDELPPLPTAYHELCTPNLLCKPGYSTGQEGYSADQMREYARASIAAHVQPKGTPSSQWAANGEPDPHGDRYACERAALTLGDLTDDELANGAFLNYNEPLNIKAVMENRPGYHPPIAWMTAVKDRIRWLSRELEKAKAAQAPAPAPDERNAFESHARRINQPLDLTRDPAAQGVYLDDRTETAWAFWEARAASAAQAPAVGAPAALRGQLNALKTQMVTYPWSSGSALLLLDDIIASLGVTRHVSDELAVDASHPPVQGS